ncbi:hypothetical protein [Haloquadratum walsbyi]|uniref:hypothetical protein n=1 Tax=Haloquadratum walsbyi TaxID=293091 RepID=UPI0015F57453|nr:hypothetical protein [Haloquadratum walsbyi]
MSEDIMNALAALGADVANISAERSERSMRVTFDLLDPDDADLVRDVAEERGESDPRKRRIALCGSLGRENGVNSKGLTRGAQTRFSGTRRRVTNIKNKRYNL